MQKNKILIIYTGGTIGMLSANESAPLVPFTFEEVSKHVPEIKMFEFGVDTISFDPPIDSSNVNPSTWKQIAAIIGDNYEDYRGFVVLHGTDTMAYSASALSFMLENLSRPVIFTGSQLPITILRTDGKENLISSIDIAAALENGKPLVPEVCIYFESKLYRGNRTIKNNAEDFQAFHSGNYPSLADAGVHIKYNHEAIHKPDGDKKLKVHLDLDPNIAIFKIFPGLTENLVESVLRTRGLRAVILETFGAGNSPMERWLGDRLKNAIDRGIIVVNVTQCNQGSVNMEKYETGQHLLAAGVVSGFDITVEAAVTKLMFLLGQNIDNEEIKLLLNKSLRGEITMV